MIQLTPPLKDLYMTQPFGVDFVGKLPGASIPFYCTINPSCKHGGWDIRAKYVPFFAGADGFTETGGSESAGLWVKLFIPLGSERYLCILHLHCQSVDSGRKNVKRGEQIGITGKTGTIAPHLHYATKIVDFHPDGSRTTVNAGNSYRGYIDPSQFYPLSLFYKYGKEFKLPIDSGYGEPQHMGELEWFKHNAWHFLNHRRLFSDRQKKALRHGYWGVREILDPGMFHTWTKITKPEWEKRLGRT